jgi:transcriptional regulator with XRE-family HTH domain
MAKIPNSIDAAIGGRLRARRMVVGMSQGALGKTLGVSFQQIQKYEKGVNRISLGHAKLLAQALEVTPAYFLEGVASATSNADGRSDTNGADDIVEFLSSSEGVQLNRSFARIRNSKVRKRLAELITALAEDLGADVPPRDKSSL